VLRILDLLRDQRTDTETSVKIGGIIPHARPLGIAERRFVRGIEVESFLTAAAQANTNETSTRLQKGGIRVGANPGTVRIAREIEGLGAEARLE
jgi:hypothetical protein